MNATTQNIHLMKWLVIRPGHQPKYDGLDTGKKTAWSLVIKQRHHSAIRILKWFMVVFFTALVVAPALLVLLLGGWACLGHNFGYDFAAKAR